MGAYSEAAEFYDLLYADIKDYSAEAELLRGVISSLRPGARTVLDVGCGTGAHARALLDRGFQVDGVDLEPAFLEVARTKCPDGEFHLADMTALVLTKRYDVVLSLFSAIGYARTEERLNAAIRSMAGHLSPGGLLLVEPWFEPGRLTDGWVGTRLAERDGLAVCRVSRTVLDGSVSRLEFEYLIGRPSGIERRSEVHELGLFTQAQMEAAFRGAGLTVERMPEELRTRGIYIGQADRQRESNG